MLAILGLLGVAMAGTAFVGLSTAVDDTDPTPDETPEDDDLSEGNMLDLVSPETDPGLETQAREAESHVELFGSSDDDVLSGSGGDDYIDGRDGDDALAGDVGDDQLHGGTGDDTLTGSEGDDQLNGHVGHDVLAGGDGNDRLQGGGGDDTLLGYDDDDDLLGGWGDDTLIGGAGQDNLQGSEGNDVVDGVTGETSAERDFLNGSEGNDHLIGNNGDVMTGGADADVFEISSGLVQVMDFTDEDIVVVNYAGEAPTLTLEPTESGITLLADGVAIANLSGLTTFDLNSVHLQQQTIPT